MKISAAAKGELYVETYGKRGKTPVFFLHGGPGDGCSLLSGLASGLGEHCFCLCFDQFGCGRSSALDPDEPFGMARHVEVIDELRASLGIEKLVLYGHGYGGMLACLYAATYPERVFGVIYDCPSLDFSDSVKSLARYFFQEVFVYKDKHGEGFRSCARIMDADYSRDPAESVKDIKRLLQYIEDPTVRFYLHRKELVSLGILLGLVSEDKAAVAKEQLFMEKLCTDGRLFGDFYGLLQQNEQPSLLLVGKHDPICSVKQRKAYIELARNGEVVVFENSGSFPHLEEPEQHLFSLLEFIDSISGRTGVQEG